jgi:alpha-1,6-mannosyltransferase
MIAMYALYVLAFTNAHRVRARWTIGALLAVHLAFFLAPPLQYTDVFNYINYGRMGVLHHLNPYTTVPMLEPHNDPAFTLSNWHWLLSPYGPLFTLFTYALVPLGVATSFWAIKLALALASLGTLALVWRCAGLLGRSRRAAVAFVGLNPIFLIWGLGADHNDTLMLFFVVLAVYLYLRSPAAPKASGAWLMVAVFIKASAALLVPIFLAAGNRRGFIRGALLAAIVLGLVSLSFFGPHVPGLGTQSKLVTGVGIPNLIGMALGQGGETATLHTIIDALLVLVLGACTLAVRRGRMHWLTAGAVVLGALTVSLSWAVPWYLAWVLPFAALAPARPVRGAVVLLGVYFLLAFMPAGYLLEGKINLKPQATKLGAVHRAEIESLLR